MLDKTADDAPSGIALFAEVHDVLLEQVAVLQGQSGPEMMAGLAELIEDFAADFALEEDLMAVLDCKARHHHAAQHAALLHWLRSLLHGDEAVCRSALDELPAWFHWHLETSDMALAEALHAAAGA
jgi:hemerythrin